MSSARVPQSINEIKSKAVYRTVVVVLITVAGIFGGVIGPCVVYVNGYRNGYQACEDKLLPHVNRLLDERDDLRKGIK